jgi:hypothetical protein
LEGWFPGNFRVADCHSVEELGSQLLNRGN